jgi:hypothetical protein
MFLSASAIFPLSQYIGEGRISPEAAEYLREAIRDDRIPAVTITADKHTAIAGIAFNR